MEGKKQQKLIVRMLNELTDKTFCKEPNSPQAEHGETHEALPEVLPDYEWLGIDNSDHKSATFQLFNAKSQEYEPELIMVIPTIDKQWFHVVYENAYRMQGTGQYVALTRSELKERYGIDMERFEKESKPDPAKNNLASYLTSHVAEINRISPFGNEREITMYFKQLLGNFFKDTK